MYRVARLGVSLCALALFTSFFPQLLFAVHPDSKNTTDENIVAKSIVILQTKDPVPPTAVRLQTIKLGGDAPSGNVTYSSLIASAKEIAAKTDANLIKINERRARSKANICDQIVATLYKTDDPHAYETEFSWTPDRKLTWEDFRGPAQPYSVDNIAAATFCSIGFETNTVTLTNKVKINVYNSFYPTKSWVRQYEKDNSHLLVHEQGHFDLCEIYTRKLRERMSNVNVDVYSLKATLRKIYNDLQQEYQTRQELYEEQTNHGLILKEQARWQNMIAQELGETEKWKDI